MSYQPLIQKDAPTISFCQAPDCSGVTMSIGRDDYFPFYYITSVTLEVVCGAYTSGPVDITSNIVSPIASGTIEYTNGTHIITGTATSFLTEFTAGESIIDSDRPYYIQPIYSVNSDTELETCNIIYRDATPGTNYRKINTEYLIDPSFLNMPYTLMPDGEYTATLTIVVGGITFTSIQNFAIICNNFCCLYEKLAAFADMCDDCMTNENIKKILDAMMAWGMLEAYLAAPYCGDTVSFATLNTKLTELCNSTPCKNC